MLVKNTLPLLTFFSQPPKNLDHATPLSNGNRNGNGNDYLYLAFLAQNGEGTARKRSRNDQKKIGHDERTARNGTGTVQKRKNYCKVRQR